MDDRLHTLEIAVARMESRLDMVLPKLVTRADLHEALHAQTWKIITAAFGLAGLLLAGLRFLR